MVNVWADASASGLRKDVTCGPLSGNVEVQLLEPLYLWHRGMKSSVLSSCRCFIPALKEEASSLNHAYTMISKKFETKRQTNTGNVFKKVYYQAQGKSWEPLHRLREKYDAQFEQRFTLNRRRGTMPLTLADSSAIDQAVLYEDDQSRLVASIDSDSLRIDEHEYSDDNEQGSRQTVKTGSLNKVLLELVRERFTTATEFDSWLEKKGIPADLRSGFPTETPDPFDELFKVLDNFFESEGLPNYRSGQQGGAIDLELLLSHAGDDEQKVLVDEEASKQLDEFLAAGWIHAGNYFKRLPFHPSKLDEPRRNIPIRIRLKDFWLSKHQKRILKKNADLQIKINPLVVPKADEELFDRHKSRFDIKPPKLIDHIVPSSSLTEIKRVTFTEDDCLIAVSYLDVGKTSTYSMYAMFEPAIEWRSLGILSILKEIEFSISEGKEFYYLGFVFDCPSFYDYKKHFRGLELFDWNGNWIRADHGRNGETEHND